MSFGVKNIMASMPRMYCTTLWLVITISMPTPMPTVLIIRNSRRPKRSDSAL